MPHEDLAKKELYSTKRMVHLTEEGPEEDRIDLEQPSLYSYIVSSAVPPEQGVYSFRDK